MSDARETAICRNAYIELIVKGGDVQEKESIICHLYCLPQMVGSHVDHTINPAVNSSSPKRRNSAT